MDKELKQYLEWLNENLQAAVKNQAMIYCELKEIEDKIKTGTESIVHKFPLSAVEGENICIYALIIAYKLL